MSAYASFFASIIACNVATALCPHSPERKAADDVEHHQGGDALLVGRHLVDGPAAVVSRNRIDPLGREFRKVVRPHGAAELRRGIENALCERPLVEGVPPLFGDFLERTGKVEIAEYLADRRGAEVRQIDPCGLAIAA